MNTKTFDSIKSANFHPTNLIGDMDNNLHYP